MIDFKNVTFSYINVNAEGETVHKNGVENLNLSISDGEFIVLTGSSGCGKTTITRLINGLIPHYYKGELSGTITINGKSIPDTPIYETAKIVGSVFQNPRSQFFNVNTTDEMAFAAENQGVNAERIKADIADTAENMQIENLLDQSIFELSGGEKQIIACAGVNILSPDIIVLDEPSSNLDFQVIEKLREILIAWKHKGKTVIIAEHRLYFLRELADRMIILENGVIKREIGRTELQRLSGKDTENFGIRPINLNGLSLNTDLSKMKSAGNIEFENFKFTYKDGKHGIDIRNLTVPQNSVIAIIGHNGAGKSTLARNICGLERKCKGVMKIGNKSYNAKQRLHQCYMIMQDVNHQLFTESVKDEVMLSITEKNLSETEKETRAMEILSQLNLADCAELHPMALSGGQKQRTAIASGIASDKDIIIFDEPTSGLDFFHMKQVSQELRKLCEIGKSVFVITHDPELISSCCNYVVQLENGRVISSYALNDKNFSNLMRFFGL